MEEVSEAGKTPTIDFINLGYVKLLGNVVIDSWVVVKAKKISKISQKKIKASG